MITGVINILTGLFIVAWCERRSKERGVSWKLGLLIILGFTLMAIGIYKLLYPKHFF